MNGTANGNVALSVEQFAFLVRYVVAAEKAKMPEGWRIPAIKTLRLIKDMDLRAAKNLVEAVEPPCDPVVGVIRQSFGIY